MTRLPPVLLWFILPMPMRAPAQGSSTLPALPDSPVGRAVDLFVKALNPGLRANLEAFHADQGGDPNMAEQDPGFYQQSGGLDLQRIVNAWDSDYLPLFAGKPLAFEHGQR